MPTSCLQPSGICRLGITVLYVFLALCATPTLAASGAGKTEKYITISELSTFCRESGRCDGRLCCEGKAVYVKGYLDPMNIFSKKTAPNLPYQKFRILELPSILNTESSVNDFLEVYPSPGNADPVFEKVGEAVEKNLLLLGIHGQIKGFDAHTNMGAYRFYYLTVDGPQDIVIMD